MEAAGALLDAERQVKRGGEGSNRPKTKKGPKEEK